VHSILPKKQKTPFAKENNYSISLQMASLPQYYLVLLW